MDKGRTSYATFISLNDLIQLDLGILAEQACKMLPAQNSLSSALANKLV
jgi:hypothetical protein